MEPGSVPVFRQYGQRMGLDAILKQGAHLIRSGHAIDGFGFDLALVDLAGSGSEIRADIFGMGLDMGAQGLECGAQALLLAGALPGGVPLSVAA